MSKKINARTATVKILLRLLKQQGSLASEMSIAKDLDDQEKRFTQELCYGLCRWFYFLESQLNQLISKPLKEKDSDIKLLLLLGIYQLQFTRVAPHAAINETVNAALFFRKQWAKKLINGVLRSFQRQQEKDQQEHNTTIETEFVPNHLAHKVSHPRWLQKAISRAWPEQAEAIFEANNQHPPFTLRVNQQHHSVKEYSSLLDAVNAEEEGTPYSLSGLTLKKACDVTQLPGFADGAVSVQDEAAQLSAPLLQLQPGLRVLDACCAPGGKTCHIGEMEPHLAHLTALDLEERRLGRVRENLQRLSINADIICADATETQSWWDGQLFDRILLDAPCSATGVIRRHPDIKLLRTSQAVNEVSELQQGLLEALWPLLAEGGILLYATCSLLPQENVQVVEQFIKTHPDAHHDVIDAEWGIEQTYGRQLLPQVKGHDGFYYARLIKHVN